MRFGLILGIVLTGFFSLLKAQEVEIPKMVKAKLFLLYPQATEVDWEKEEDKYVASFEIADKEIEVTLESSGKFVKSETELEPSQLPEKARQYVHRTYKSPVEDALKIKTADGKIKYEADVTGMDVFFDEKGNFLSAEKAEKKDEPAKKE